MIDISIIIPVYNPGKLVKRCLDSIVSQRGSYSYEVLMVDDGSTDNSSSIIKSYNNASFVLMHQENAGPAKARNRGIDAAKGRYIAFIDADDYWLPDFFEKMISFMDSHPDCVAASTGQKHLTVSGEGVKNISETCVLSDFYKYWADNMHVCTGSMIARTDVVKALGGQRTDLRITEDLEFWVLLATQGKWGIVEGIHFVSDGTELVKGDGWLKKMQVRWNNAPLIANWEKRILEVCPEIVDNKSYLKARGKISRNLTYCQILSGRLKESRKEALTYGNRFPKDTIAKLMNLCKHFHFTWWILAKLFVYRETHRK